MIDGGRPPMHLKFKVSLGMEIRDYPKKSAQTLPEFLHEVMHTFSVRTRPTKEDFSEHWYATCCPRCRALIREVAPQPHTEDCRTITEALLQSCEAVLRRKRLAGDRASHRLASHIYHRASYANTGKVVR